MPSHKITRTVHFSYGHRIVGHNGKCRNLHGHNGIVEVDVESNNLNDLGMVMDFGNLKDIVEKWITENLDHRMILHKDDPAVLSLTELNEPLYILEDNPTAENLAQAIYKVLHSMDLNVTEVRFWETLDSRASYSD